MTTEAAEGATHPNIAEHPKSIAASHCIQIVMPIDCDFDS